MVKDTKTNEALWKFRPDARNANEKDFIEEAIQALHELGRLVAEEEVFVPMTTLRVEFQAQGRRVEFLDTTDTYGVLEDAKLAIQTVAMAQALAHSRPGETIQKTKMCVLFMELSCIPSEHFHPVQRG